jgi:hypothetical protein
MLKMSFYKWVSYTTIKPFIILGVTLFSVMSGKSSWVPSRTQGFVPTCCRWADVLRLLYQLPLPCDGRSLGPWAVVIHYFSSDGDDPELALYFKHCVRVWFEQNASATLIWTWFVITMFKLRCILWCKLLCNLWWWPLNLVRSWLLCELVWNPSWFHRLPGYMGLSLLNRPHLGWFSYLISYNWAVLLQDISKSFDQVIRPRNPSFLRAPPILGHS